MLLADKGYDSDELVLFIDKQETTAVIPPRSHRIEQRCLDLDIFRERHKIECFFGFLKHDRKLFARFEKLASRFVSFLHFVAA